MIVFPAIDIQKGLVVRLRQGVENDSVTYFEDPVKTAVKWYEEGAAYLHVVDLDGAFAGTPQNGVIIRQICEAVPIPVEVGGGIRSAATIEDYLEKGVARVIIGSLAVEDEGFLQETARQYAKHLAVSIDAKNDVVATHGWVDGSDKTVLPFAERVLEARISTIIYTDIGRDGMLSGPNLPMLQKLQCLPGIRLIASGGIGTVDDLRNLRTLGVYGAITGKALYEGRITMAEICELAGGA
ncbi:1-(5-phosphoribosyl)-5-[(5-phosphoribosylamino)methylideneamino]imidazole-4-carboxamide isomerase [Colibacter massiliensis]|uniref:1-(5-phosphoribosyl)-5-[(5- phosphoribosylamino)methylideneamino]imidazole-4- carboxamide isomerase n=1 Tax=Colibacter massiliensis TaxID=1852379 RepID=UPI003F8ED390